MKTIKIIQTRKTNRIFWQEMPNIVFGKIDNIANEYIRVDSSKTYQTIIGFGGAFTEASGVAIDNLPQVKKDELIKAYYSKDGLNYNLGRVHINSCDFCLNNYCYVEENDNDLSTFDISHEERYVIPMLKKAYEYSNNNLKILASPWPAPAYMKTNNNMNYGGKIKEEYMSLWAKYYVKYIEEMQKRGISIDALTVQNEPLATQTWDSCLYSPNEEKDFIKNYLGPELYKNNLKHIHLYAYDHNRGNVLIDRAIAIFDDKKANKYVTGLAFHWYVSEDYDSLRKVSEMYPDKTLLFTEGCVEYGIYGDESKLRWENGEFYAHHMINDFNNYSTGFIDWNLFLDEKGGPNHVGNYCEAPIMIDNKNNSIIYNVSYYYIGHFSKYVEKDAKRVLTTTCADNTIESVSFKNKNNEIIVIIMNKGWIKNITLIVDGKKGDLILPNQSITTFVISK